MANRGTLLAVAVVTLCLLASCSSERREQDLRIGLVAPLSGSLAPIGVGGVNAARLVVEDVNGGRGVQIGGRRYRVVLVEKDGANSPEASLEAAHELIAKDGVVAIIGPAVPVNAVPVVRLGEKLHVPVVVRAVLGPEATRGSLYAVRLTCDDTTEGTAVARFVLGTLSLRRAALLYDSSNLGNPFVAEAFRARFASDGGSLTAILRYTYGRRDFDAQLRAAIASRPSCLFLPNFSYDVLRQVKRARELGFSGAIVCGSAMSFSAPSDIARVEGTWMPAPFVVDRPSPVVKQFVRRFRAAYGSEPTTSAALAFDAFALVVAAAREASAATPEAIGASLRRPRIFEGVTGTMRFDGGPDPVTDVTMARVVDGSLSVRGAKP